MWQNLAEKKVDIKITGKLVFISSHVTAIVTSLMTSKIDIRIKIQKRNSKDFKLVSCIEFSDFWWKPYLN